MVVPVTKTITIVTSGVPQPIFTSAESTAHPIVAVQIQPQTGTILIGDSTISFTASPKKGYPASPTAPFILNPASDAIDLRQCYIDASANGTVVNILYFQKVSH